MQILVKNPNFRQNRYFGENPNCGEILVKAKHFREI